MPKLSLAEITDAFFNYLISLALVQSKRVWGQTSRSLQRMHTGSGFPGPGEHLGGV